MRFSRLATIPTALVLVTLSGCRHYIPRVQYVITRSPNPTDPTKLVTGVASVIHDKTRLVWHYKSAFSIIFTHDNPCQEVGQPSPNVYKSTLVNGTNQVTCTVKKDIASRKDMAAPKVTYPYNISFGDAIHAQDDTDHCEGCVFDPNDQ